MRKTLLILTLFVFVSASLIAQSWGKGMIVKPGWTLTNGSNTTIYIQGGAGSTLLLEDDNTYNPSMIVEGDIIFEAGSDSVRFQQYLPKDAWHFVSSTVFPEFNDTYLWHYLYSYEEPNWQWHNMHAPLGQSLIAGEGYTNWNPSVGDPYPTPGDFVEQKGLPLNTSVQDYALSYQYNSSFTDSIGWNLVGNPFTAALDWNGHADWNLQNVTPTIYFYNDANGSYDTYNYNTGATGDASNIIAAGQAVFVKATATGAKMDFPVSQRFHSPTTDLWKSSNEDPKDLLRIEVEKDGMSNEIVIGFNKNTKEAYDEQFDALYLASSTSVADIYSIENGKKYVQYWNPTIIESVSLGFEAHSNGVYQIHFSNTENFESFIYLEDTYTQVWQNISQNHDYSFAANVTDDLNRFVIHFLAPNGIEDLEENSMANIFSFGKSIYIQTENRNAEVYVYDLLGNEILKENTSNKKTIIPMDKSNSYFLVKVIANNSVITKKVFIQ